MAALLLPSVAAASDYDVRIDLASLTDDRLYVEVNVPTPTTDTATFIFPVTVPGTYEEHRWWRFVHEFSAFDAQGKPLSTYRSADSQFVIRDAKRLHHVAYWVDDSFDDPSDKYAVFQPAGTSFEADGIFVFNHAGIVGYVEGKQAIPYRVTVRRPATLYCATSLRVSERTEQFDVYHAPSYDHLIDGPVMYCKPDTATFNVNGTRVLVALAHRRDTSLAQAYADDLEKVTFAIEKFLPSLPVDRYAFLLYLWDGDTVNVKRARYSQGALEHSYSSFYFWRLTTRPFGLRDVAAHEFLHILVPLNVHSREIDEFNFRNPEWSAHLWLYEGVTEYFAEQSLLRSGIFNESTFLNHVKRGARSMQHLPDGFSLADFSRNVLSDENQSLYPLIYQYGPINALVMDIILREEMGTKGGLLELVYALMDRYGPSKPFDDDELFDVISELSSKRVADYCKTYINGSKRVPLAEYLPKIGMTYSDSVLAEAWTFDVDITSSTQTEGGLMIAPLDKNPLGVEEGDRLVAVDGVEVSRENSRILRRLWNPQSDSTISLTVVRSGMTIELSGKPNKTAVVRQHVVEEIPNATAEQVAFRNLVLYGSTTSPFKDNR